MTDVRSDYKGLIGALKSLTKVVVVYCCSYFFRRGLGMNLRSSLGSRRGRIYRCIKCILWYINVRYWLLRTFTFIIIYIICFITISSRLSKGNIAMSTKKTGKFAFVTFWKTFVIWQSEKPIISMALLMSDILVDRCKLRITTRKA